MKFKDYKYKSIFASTVKCIIDSNKDPFLSKASIEELKNIIPKEVMGEGKDDLLPIASNLALINARNLNGDCLSGEMALKIYPSLLNKYLNIEHHRATTTCGHVVSVGFSKYNSNYRSGLGSEILKIEDIKDDLLKEPFNLSYGAVLYKLVAPEELIDGIIESSDPQNKEKYLSISSSWEVAYSDYAIVVGSQYLKDAKVIQSDDPTFEEYSKYLQVNGGTGTKDGQYVYRLLQGDAMFIGAALTESPAALTKGLVVANGDNINPNIEFPSNSSINLTKSVITNNNTNFNDTMTLKTQDNKEIVIEKIADLTDENLKVAKASSVIEFVADEIKKASEQYVKDIESKANAAKLADEKSKELETLAKSLKDDVTKLTEQLNTINNQIIAKQNQENFDQRMASFDNEFELDTDEKEAIASDIKDLDEKGFEAYAKKMNVFFKNKKKGAKKPADKGEPDADDKDKSKATEIVVASTTTDADKTTAATVVADAVANATADKTVVPNTAAPELTVYEKYKKAFNPDEGFKFEGVRRK